MPSVVNSVPPASLSAPGSLETESRRVALSTSKPVRSGTSKRSRTSVTGLKSRSRVGNVPKFAAGMLCLTNASALATTRTTQEVVTQSGGMPFGQRSSPITVAIVSQETTSVASSVSRGGVVSPQPSQAASTPFGRPASGFCRMSRPSVALV